MTPWCHPNKTILLTFVGKFIIEDEFEEIYSWKEIQIALIKDTKYAFFLLFDI